MKKALPLIAALILMLACGCEKQSKSVAPPPAPSSFAAELSVDFGETQMTAKLVQKNFDEFEISMLSPEIMKDLTLYYSNGECTASFGGLEFRTEANRFPQAEFGGLLTQAISAIGQNIDIQKTFDGNVWTYKGLGNRGEFTLIQNKDSGEWISFAVESADLKVEFSNINKT